MSTRSSVVNIGLLSMFRRTATITSSKRWADRSMMSRWPLVRGSNVPGYIARRVTCYLLVLAEKMPVKSSDTSMKKPRVTSYRQGALLFPSQRVEGQGGLALPHLPINAQSPVRLPGRRLAPVLDDDDPVIGNEASL